MTDHLVAYEYGTGVVWGCVRARSADDIRTVIPEVDVYGTPPAWMTSDRVRSLRERAVYLGDDVLDSIVHRRSPTR